MSRNAFRFGRLAAREPGAIARLIGADTTTPPKPVTLESLVAFRAEQLAEYQDATLAQRYRERVARIAEIERTRAPGRGGLAEAVAWGYFKLLAYKDEYEVARLYASPAFEKALSEQFEQRRKLEFHLAPPLLARRDKATGEPRKMRFGAWRKVNGSGFREWITSGNLIASRMKKTARLLPTRSQLPSSV